MTFFPRETILEASGSPAHSTEVLIVKRSSVRLSLVGSAAGTVLLMLVFYWVVGTSAATSVDPAHRFPRSFVLIIVAASGAAILALGAFTTIVVVGRLRIQRIKHSTVLSTALDNMSNGLIMIDANGRFELFNRRFIEMNKLSSNALEAGMTHKTWLDVMARARYWSEAYRAEVEEAFWRWSKMAEGDNEEYITADGRVIEVSSRPVEGSGAVVITFDDVTRDRETQKHLSDLAFLDPLTKLANRRALQQRMEQDFFPKQRFKLILVDLDRFKVVNDTYGHGVGDELLIQVGERLTNVIGGNGFAARLGGDEMAVLVNGDVDQSMTVAGAILSALHEPFAIDGLSISIGCSVGMCCTDDASSVEQLMQRSDVALYEAKRQGRGQISCYKPGMLEAVAELRHLEDDMRLAIERGQIHLVYQPVYSFEQDGVIGYEALIRWKHPVHGFVSPDRFIPLAEENGQIVAIGRWVLEQACLQAAVWPNDHYVAVNVSPAQFRSPLLMAHLTQALAMSGLPAHRLEIELTETAMVQDSGLITRTLNAIRYLGVKIALDDFGTGYSSLAHLRDFPFDRIKVDRSFVTLAESDRHSLAVLRGISQIGQELNISILAEGVETKAQMELVKSAGCNAVQGYLIGRPEAMQYNESRDLVA